MAESDADKILRLEADLDEALDLIDKYENDDSTAKRLTDAERQLEILSREKHDFEDRFNSLFGERAQLEDDLRERDRALANATAEREASEALIKDIRRQLNAAQEEVEVSHLSPLAAVAHAFVLQAAVKHPAAVRSYAMNCTRHFLF